MAEDQDADAREPILAIIAEFRAAGPHPSRLSLQPPPAFNPPGCEPRPLLARVPGDDGYLEIVQLGNAFRSAAKPASVILVP